MTNDFLTIRSLRKVYNPDTAGEVVALSDLSFSVTKGEFITIVGGNATGKTTLFNVMSRKIRRARFTASAWCHFSAGIPPCPFPRC